MIIASEEKYEQAWVHALALSPDLAGFSVRQWSMQTVNATFPVILVSCTSVEDPTSGIPDGYDRAVVDISAQSSTPDDPDKTIVNMLIGAVRGWINRPNDAILAALESVGGISVQNVTQPEESFVDDTDVFRVRTMTMHTYGSLLHSPTP